jgi:hypothetical protein
MEKWFCIWEISDYPKIIALFRPKPVVVPERQAMKKPILL